MPGYSSLQNACDLAVGFHPNIWKCPTFSLFELGVLTLRRIAFLSSWPGLAPFEVPLFLLPAINKTWRLIFIFTLVNVHPIKML